MTDVERERFIRALNMAVADRDAALDLLREVRAGFVSMIDELGWSDEEAAAERALIVKIDAFLARVDSDA